MKLKPNDITLAALDDMVVNSDESDDEIIDEEYQSFYDFLNSHFPITNEVNLNLVESQIQTDQRYKRLLIDIMSEMVSNKLKMSVEIIMKTIIDDVLLKTYSYHNGRKASIPKNFYELNLSDIVFETLVRRPRYASRFEDTEREVKAYILQAEDRYNKKNKK